MSQIAAKPLPIGSSEENLPKLLLALALPVFAENALHMLVGLNDTYLANKLPKDAAAAGAAVGTITYLVWFFNLLVMAVAAGSTSIISRAKGARHRRQANSVTGQSMAAALILGIAVGLFTLIFARQLVAASDLSPSACRFALPYLRMLSVTLPFLLTMSIASACLRGNGNTLAPAIAMIVVDIVNVIFSWGLCRGLWGMPNLGFNGIAIGTVIAYIVGGFLQLAVLVSGRLFKIGLPAGVDSLINWLANFGVLRIINHLDVTNAFANAHMNAVRIESISFMTGFAFAPAAATLVGQSLGMKDLLRAKRSAYLAFAMGGGAMTLIGIFFIFFGYIPARLLAPDPHIAALTTHCLRITGFIQSGFAAYAIFTGALRGAGDTFFVMLFTLFSVLGLRLLGVIIVGSILHKGLGAIWIVLAAELFFRGVLAFARFLQGSWQHIEV